MKVRQLLEAVDLYSADGRNMEEEVLLKVGRESRRVEASYSDGTFVLIAGPPIPQ